MFGSGTKVEDPGVQREDIDCHPVDAGEALASLELLTARLRERGDARSVFLDVYVVITREVLELVSAPESSGFWDPRWLSVLTARFAEEALVAVVQSIRREPVASAAWRFATYYAEHGITPPYQSAILGINAHINFDLARAVHEDFEARQLSGDALRRYRHDYFKVDELLERCVGACLDVLVERYRCRSTEALLRLPGSRSTIRSIVMVVVGAWRRRAWLEVVSMLAAGDERERDAIVRRMDRFSGRVAQLVVAREAVRYVLRHGAVPFQLRRRAETWPDVAPAAARRRAANVDAAQASGRAP